MFERYTEKARRVIFFARYECSQYGSPEIDPQHMLIALTREAPSLLRRVLEPDLSIQDIRSELEKFIPRGIRIPTSAEVPLSEDSKKVLLLAVEESERSGNLHVGPEHILLGLFMDGESPAARILKRAGRDITTIRDLVLEPPSVPEGAPAADAGTRPPGEVMATLEKFLARIRSGDPPELPLPLANNALVVDWKGLLYRGQNEINKSARAVFGLYSGMDVKCSLVRVLDGPDKTFVAIVLWFNVTPDLDASKPGHVMTVVLGQEIEDWLVWYVQVTPMVITT